MHLESKFYLLIVYAKRYLLVFYKTPLVFCRANKKHRNFEKSKPSPNATSTKDSDYSDRKLVL